MALSWLYAYLAQLPPRDRALPRLRFQQDLRQREIGALLGISQMHVSRLIRRSLGRLQAAATEEAGVAGQTERRRPLTTARARA